MAPRPSPQTERVVTLFEQLAEDGSRGMTLAEVSRHLSVHKASCHSMLSELLRAGWLLRDPVRKTYHLGPALIRLGREAASRYPALVLARSAMAELSATTGAHCIAFSVSDDCSTVVDQVRSPHGGGHPMPVGTQFPHRPPYGAPIVAWASPEARERWLASLPEDVRDRYREALAAAKRRGYAVGLHILPDLRLRELAQIVRSAEVRSTRLSQLAQALTDELIHTEEWFPISLDPDRTYEVSHIDSPILEHGARIALMLSLVPRAKPMSAAAVIGLGEQLSAVTRRLSAALTEKSPAGRIDT
ncbi:transcriptional regulator [Mycobacterium heckeshornense]|uniref:Putative transcriptional regulator, IclR family protein n=1 Tax=Mycobacterium heckeshornense TaxID=110505 RepID=A0A2G8B3N5_9MYCO|nr:helix-turn-helix domain-containing protein [Mycobacterium heckeshornense]KMV22627.1 transcriptional regulator [Mycobacterium heckeshornense]MCV7034286.1 helix-turn-helix domain-containing protein [Mycobacterium heckeshornense]PIJ32375.1 transcriptional regulator [Mycobacterium heckeshornense]BCO38362.1 putative transcriptional regulator, IclR family protein [Mycobacterium heckeshornense]